MKELSRHPEFHRRQGERKEVSLSFPNTKAVKLRTEHGRSCQCCLEAVIATPSRLVNKVIYLGEAA